MARIFIAIRFDEGFKRGLVALQDALKARGVRGNYCPYGNLHMTLAFIGENYDLTAIRKAVSEVAFDPFELSLDHLGSFPTKAGVIWCGLKDNTESVCRGQSTQTGYPRISWSNERLGGGMTVLRELRKR